MSQGEMSVREKCLLAGQIMPYFRPYYREVLSNCAKDGWDRNVLL